MYVFDLDAGAVFTSSLTRDYKAVPRHMEVLASGCEDLNPTWRFAHSLIIKWANGPAGLAQWWIGQNSPVSFAG